MCPPASASLLCEGELWRRVENTADELTQNREAPQASSVRTTDTLFSLSKMLSLTRPCIDLSTYSMAIANHLEDIPDLSGL